MCFMSAVFDQWQPHVPQPTNPWTPSPYQTAPPWSPPTPPGELRELIDALKQALEAAETFDRLTGQPDCEDADKAKLLDRVAELERRLDELAA